MIIIFDLFIVSTQSHPIGPGPGLSRVLFNLQGQSPLVAHYLEMRQLKEKGQPGRKVRRTEIKKMPYPSEVYKIHLYFI